MTPRKKRPTTPAKKARAPQLMADYWTRTYPTRQALFKDKPSESRPTKLTELTSESLEQFEAARQTAMKVLDSGAVGDGECVITISGHANEGHAPKNGRANDRVSISIQQGS
jgi:hypothetical protein